MSDQDFKAAVAISIKGRTALLKSTRDEIIRLLKLAQDQIAVILAGQPTDYQLWALPELQKQIARVLEDFSRSGSATIGTAAGNAWQAGLDLVDQPFKAAGKAEVISALPYVDAQQLNAMRAFMTDRIRNISLEAANAINTQLGLVVIGAQSPGDAITATRRILGDQGPRRATTIVRTELGRLFATAAHQRMLQAVQAGANIRKKWIKSGKVHSRPGHDAIHGEIRRVDEPFEVIGKDGVIHQLMYPHDPKAPASETINCGCVAVPTASGFEGAMFKSMVGKADGTPYTNAELRARAAARHPGGPGMQARVQEAYDPNQPRDNKGRWAKTGGISSSGARPRNYLSALEIENFYQESIANGREERRPIGKLTNQAAISAVLGRPVNIDEVVLQSSYLRHVHAYHGENGTRKDRHPMTGKDIHLALRVINTANPVDTGRTTHTGHPLLKFEHDIDGIRFKVIGEIREGRKNRNVAVYNMYKR